MSIKQQKQFKTHTGLRQYEGLRRAPVCRRLIFLRDTRENIINSTDEIIQMCQDIQKATRQKTALYMLQLQTDHFVEQCNQAIKSTANIDGNGYHYKGVK
jgi:hypothetical protein